MTPDAKLVLQLRQQVNKSSVKKLEALAARVSPDGTLRRNYRYYGAHTGRWSGEGVQLQNLPRPIKSLESEEDYDAAVGAIRDSSGDVDLLAFGPILDVVASCIRGAFRAPQGKVFVVADLSAIENRVLAWLSGCQSMTNVYVNKLDPYKAFASEHLYRVPYDEVTKAQRQMAKPAVLGCGYQLSGGFECWYCPRCNEARSPEEAECQYCAYMGITVPQTDVVKTGLWGYAESMGVQMTEDEAHAAVKAFREGYPEVVALWRNLQNAAITAVLERTRVEVGHVAFVGKKGLLCAVLPSGRSLYYVRPEVVKGEYGPVLTYWGVDSTTKQWRKLQTYGGKLTENLVQAISRDVLGEGMLRADAAGFTIVGHTHDEIITLENEDVEHDGYLGPLSLEHLIDCMTKPMPWAPDLVLGADGYTSTIYRK